MDMYKARWAKQARRYRVLKKLGISLKARPKKMPQAKKTELEKAKEVAATAEVKLQRLLKQQAKLNFDIAKQEKAKKIALDTMQKVERLSLLLAFMQTNKFEDLPDELCL